MSPPAENQPRAYVDASLASAGWTLQDGDQANPNAAYAIAVRRFPLAFSPHHGNSDYLLYLGGIAVAVIRILPVLPRLRTPIEQDQSGSSSVPDNELGSTDDRILPSAEPAHWASGSRRPVERRQGARSAFVYETDGVRIHFRDARQEPALPHLLFHFHRPAALAAWLMGKPVPITNHEVPARIQEGAFSDETFLQRLQGVPKVTDRSLWAGERLVLEAFETALRRGHRRIIAQMAAGSGKTHTLLNLAYQVLEHGKAARVLMIVDNDPLAYQTAQEFRALRPPVHAGPTATPLPFDVFPESHNLSCQQLSGHAVDPDARLVITSPYRLLALWTDNKPAGEELVSKTLFSPGHASRLPLIAQPDGSESAPYNSWLPTESFEVVLCDDLSPATFAALAPLLNYFDAQIIATAATPCASTLAIFQDYLVAEYPYEQAIADGSILPYDTYAIRITEDADHKLEAQAGPLEIHRQSENSTRIERWKSTEDLVEAVQTSESERNSAPDDLTDFTLLLCLRDRLPREIFAQRVQIPKTLIIARDTAHAQQLLELTREVFSAEDYFTRILTTPAEHRNDDYGDMVFRHQTRRADRTHGEPRTPTPDSHYPYLTDFRSDVFPRIGIIPADSFAVTVDLRPVELLVLLAPLTSRAHFEALKARAIRTVRRAEYLRTTPDGHQVAGKTHAVIVDMVGMFDTEAPSETFPLDRRPAATLAQLLQEVAFGAVTEHTIRAIAARFLDLDCLLSPQERDSIAKLAGGATLHTLATRLITCVDRDRQIAHASRGARAGTPVSEKMIEQAAAVLMQQAVARLHTSTELRGRIIQLERQYKPRPKEEDAEEPLPTEDIGNEETWR